jgi:MFS transporter, FLVCR family, MFS-domain-containing protein 7
MPILKSLRALKRNGSFYLIFIPFAVYVGFFNALSSLLNQILEPYGLSENQAGQHITNLFRT